MKTQNKQQAPEKAAAPAQFSALDSQAGENSALPPTLQLKSSSETAPQTDASAPIQARLAGTHGWMNDIDLDALSEKLGGHLDEHLERP